MLSKLSLWKRNEMSFEIKSTNLRQFEKSFFFIFDVYFLYLINITKNDISTLY